MTKPKALKPGLYQMSAADYHRDPCPTPSLSASLAHILLADSPRHAWWNSPRLNPAYERTQKKEFDLGNAGHAFLLEGRSGVVIIEMEDFKTKAAREARDAAYAAEKIPLIAERWADVQAMAESARAQLAEHEDPPIPLTNGTPEQTLIWREGDIWCRARLDWLHDDRRFVDDYKSTGGSANPDVWTRGPLFNNGFDVQAAMYLRGLKAVFGIDATFRFVVQETFKPFALSVIGLAPSALELAERKVKAAITAWKYCVETDRWPGYPTRCCWAEAPPWEEMRWGEREIRAEVVDDGRPLASQLLGEAP